MLSLFKRRPEKTDAERVYDEIVAAARRPWFYAVAGGPDTIEGRFDFVVLHAFLVMRRLRAEGDAVKAKSQAIFDAMFKELDAALREIGVGDLSVAKKIRGLAEAFYGRSQAYDAALEAGDDDALALALSRNIYGEEDAPGARLVADYVKRADAALAAASAEDVLAARLPFPDPETTP